MQLINDEQTFNGAKHNSGRAILTYDDGYGPLWILRDSMGILGIARAKTWELAYEICEDEFFPEADETIEEIEKEYNFKRVHERIIHPVIDGRIETRIERPARPEDYPLREGQAVRWDTTEIPCPESWSENELFQEAYGFRPNGPNKRDKLQHGIYARDLNGETLELLTPETIEALGIVLQIGMDSA